MGKISLINIAEELAAKSGLGRDVTDNFLHAFVEAIEKGLNEDNLVKIKGLGTFKLLEVSDRGSIDVNTGARITIKGHTKVSFTPDNAMKEFVNRPFSHFEPTELNDGYSEEELMDTPSYREAEENDAIAENVAEQPIDDNADSAVPTEVPSMEVVAGDTDTPSVVLDEEPVEAVAEAEQTEVQEVETIQVEEQEASTTEEVDTSSLDEPIEPVNEVVAPLEKTDKVEVVKPAETADAQEPSETEVDEALAEVVEPFEEPASEPEPIAEPIVEATSEEETGSALAETAVAEVESVVTAKATASAEVQPVAKAAAAELQITEATPAKRRARWPFVVLVLMLAGGAYYYVSTDKLASAENAVVEEEASIMVKPNLENEFVDEPGEAPIVQQAQATAHADTVKYAEVAVPAPVAQPVSEPVNEPVSAPKVKPASQSAVTPTTLVITESLAAKSIKDITPADTTDYLIDGTQCTHTLQSGETIIQLARKYYGDKRLWPYIVKHNYITDFNKVGVGMEIKIPVLKFKTSE